MAPASSLQAMTKKDDTIIHIKYTEWGLNAYDTALCLIPIGLIVKIVLCIIAHNRDNWATGFYVDDASYLTVELIRLNGQLTTAFTIIFVMIATTFLRRFALWRVQTGESVARLEQFQSSSSLPSTLKLVVSLRSFNFISLGLVIGWSFYYVGSQASKNEYTLQNLHSYGHRGKFGAIYQKPDAPSFYINSAYTDQGSSGQSQQRLQAAAFILSASGASISGPQPSDMFGNAAVPYIDASGTTTDTFGQANNLMYPVDKKGWFVILHDQLQYTAYSSYAGIPFFSQPYLEGLPSATGPTAISGSYAMNSSYFTLDCQQPEKLPASRFPLGANSTSDFALTLSNETTTTKAGEQRSFELWQKTNSEFAMVKCGIAMVYVESKIHCDGTKCIVQKFRKTLGQETSTKTPFDDITFANRILKDFAISEELINLATYWSQVADFLTSDYTFDNVGFSYQMSQVLNTFYYNSQFKLYPDSLCRGCTGGDPTYYAVAEGNATDPVFQRASMKGSIYDPAYVLNWAWVVVDFISNAILLVAAIMAFWLRKNTLAPDIFGYVSSLTRDNPNLSVPDGGTALSGLERSRMLRDVKVKIVDVGASDGLGRVALTNIEASDVSGLQRDKRYV